MYSSILGITDFLDILNFQSQRFDIRIILSSYPELFWFLEVFFRPLVTWSYRELTVLAIIWMKELHTCYDFWHLCWSENNPLNLYLHCRSSLVLYFRDYTRSDNWPGACRPDDRNVARISAHPRRFVIFNTMMIFVVKESFLQVVHAAWKVFTRFLTHRLPRCLSLS